MNKPSELNKRTNARIQTLALKIIDPRTENLNKCINEIIELVMPKLKFYIWKFMKNDKDVEDVLFNTLEKIYINIQGYNPNYQFTTWCFTIARNEALTWNNELAKLNTSNMLDVDMAYNPDYYNLDIAEECAEDALELDTLLSDLQSQYAKVRGDLVMSVSLKNIKTSNLPCVEYNEAMEMFIDKINKMKVSGIAKEYGYGENTVKTKLRYARSLISNLMKNEL